MVQRIDFSKLSLRGAFDFAILIEEDAQVRYHEFSLQVTDPGASAFFREMVVNEGKHRAELVSRRNLLFRSEPPRIETSILDGTEPPDPSEILPALSAREAMEVALRAEKRAWEFYAAAIPHVQDPEVRAFFQDLMREEEEHQELLVARLASLPPGA